jgi:hypothetical protein
MTDFGSKAIIREAEPQDRSQVHSLLFFLDLLWTKW